MRARRALLYVPGDDLHKLQKASALGVDCVCMDLEDGVALNKKGSSEGNHCAGFADNGFWKIGKAGAGQPITDKRDRRGFESCFERASGWHRCAQS